MANNSLKWLAMLGCFAAGLCTSASAQDSGALLDALVRKGILSDQEAEDIRADLTRDFASTNIFASPAGKSVSRLQISGRIQAQFDHLATDNSSATGSADPAYVNHFFLRRVYLGAKADFGPDWSGNLVYDFAGERFDSALIEYKVNSDLTLGAGLRKVDFGYEERTSSTRLKAIERSGITRYFVEDNNGRRLGAGAHRIGVFANGTAGNFFYGAAITNPERVGNFDSTTNNPSQIGTNANNTFAYWANAGVKGNAGSASYVTGFGLGHLPDQASAGNDISVGSVYADVTVGAFNISAEYMYGEVEGAVDDVNPSGFYIQPAFKINEKLELVARYSHLDTDGRGVAVSDGIRNAPSSVSNYDTLTDYYVGFNYYFKGTDVKLSAGYVWGEGEDRLGGQSGTSEVNGFRSQLQVVF